MEAQQLTPEPIPGSIGAMDALSTIRRLLRGGAPSRAWAALCAAGLDGAADNPAVLTLKGRVLKDRAMLASGADRQALLRGAAEAYAAAAALSDDSYPRINAATLVFLRGDRAAAAMLARDLLVMLDNGTHGAETPYWLAATRAEALLLTGRVSEAKAAMAEAVALAPAAREDRAATLRQFRHILAETGSDDSWLAPFRLPPSMVFRGPMALARDSDVAAIRAAVEGIRPGFAYGALAAGSDIVAAEAALDLGAELVIVLPADVARFRAASVDPFGAEWGTRFDRLLASAASVDMLDEPGGMTTAAVQLAAALAMGLAARDARVADDVPVLLDVTGCPAPVSPGTDSHRSVPVPVALRDDCPAVALPGPDDACLWIVDGGGMAAGVPLADLREGASFLIPGCSVDASAGGRQAPPADRLRGLRRPDTIVATRTAALILASVVPWCRPVVTGSIDSADGPIDIYEILADTPPVLNAAD